MSSSPQGVQWCRRPRGPQSRVLATTSFPPRSLSSAAAALPGRIPSASSAAPPAPHHPRLIVPPRPRYSRSSCPAAASSSRGPSCLENPDGPFQGLPAAPLTSSRSPLAAAAARSSRPLTAALSPGVRPAGSMSAPAGLRPGMRGGGGQVRPSERRWSPCVPAILWAACPARPAWEARLQVWRAR